MKTSIEIERGSPLKRGAIPKSDVGETPPSAHRPRIGICDQSTAESGVSRYVEALIESIDPHEFDTVLFCRKNGPYHARPNVRLVHLPVAGESEAEPPGSATASLVPYRSPTLLQSGWRQLAPGPLKLWAGFWRESLLMAKTFRRWPVDLLHTNNAGGYEETSVGGRLAAIPRILGTFHIGSTNSTARAWILEFVTNRCLDRAIAVSEATRRDWLRRTCLPAGRVITIPNGVDSETYCRRLSPEAAREQLGLRGENRLVIGCTGRLSEQKGHRFLLEAVAHLAADYPQLTLVLAGDGPLKTELVEHSVRLGIAGQIQFLGHRRDVQTIYDASDIFALPSLWEAMPFSLLEAMATGLTSVATAVAGVPELILPGRTGFLVPPADPRALAESFRPLLDSPDLRIRIGSAARDYVKKFYGKEKMIAETIEVYRQVINK